MTEILVAIGGNSTLNGTALKWTLEQVIGRLAGVPYLDIIAQSAWYRTAAFPHGSGPDFLNAAVSVQYSGTPEALLTELHSIEAAFGRVRDARWGPRTCDLDLIGFGQEVRPDHKTFTRWMGLTDEESQNAVPKTLLLPHPRMHRRAFVLVPLCDIAPDWRHPVLNQTVTEMCEALPASAHAEVHRLD